MALKLSISTLENRFYFNLKMKRRIILIVLFLFTSNLYVHPVHAKSQKKVVAQAEQGDAQAQYELAMMYEKGKGVEQNIDEALKWFNKAAGNGHVGSMIDLGWFYQNGQYVEKDVDKAIEWYEKAAEQGNPQAQHNLAFLYDEGIGVSENNEKAALWYQEAVARGHGVAQLNLGILYLNGEGVEQNNERAWNLLNLARMNRMNIKARWRARSLLDEMKQKLRIKAGELSYPAWDKLKYYKN